MNRYPSRLSCILLWLAMMFSFQAVGLAELEAAALLSLEQHNTNANTADNRVDTDTESSIPSCTVCMDPTEAVSRPDATVFVPALSSEVSCQSLQDTLMPLLNLPQDDPLCTLIHTVSPTICGCQSSPFPIPQSPCRLCGSSGSNSNKNETSTGVPDSLHTKAIQYFNQETTCGLAEISIAATLESTSDECQQVLKPASVDATSNISDLVQSCCHDDDSDQEAEVATNTTNTVIIEPCPICWDGSEITRPDKIVNHMAENIGFEFDAATTNLTCSGVAALISQTLTVTKSTDNNNDDSSRNDQCLAMQIVFGGMCGCPRVPDSCNFCAEGELEDGHNILWPDKVNVPPGIYMKHLPTCQESADITHQIPYAKHGLVQDLLGLPGFDGDICRNGGALAYVCGCYGGQRQYMGANTEAKRVTLAWIPRLTGLLSFVCSSLILWDVVKQASSSSVKNRNGRRRQNIGAGGGGITVYHTLVAGLSLSDISSSLVWTASTAPIQKTFDKSYGSFPSMVYFSFASVSQFSNPICGFPAYYELSSTTYSLLFTSGALGNETTCSIQGFFMELGVIGSISYNVALCVYYMLVIVKGKREDELRKRQWYFHGACILMAFGFAFAAIPDYEFSLMVCMVSGPTAKATWKYTRVFLIYPIAISTFLVTATMLYIYLHVRRTTKAAQRWNFRAAAPSQNDETKVWYKKVSCLFSKSTGSNNSSSSSLGERQHRLSTLTATAVATTTTTANTTGARHVIERAVFWQSVCFLLAFYATWPFFYASQFKSDSDEYAFWIAVGIFTPLQGFFNALVYARPRFLANRRNRQQERERAARQQAVVAAQQQQLGNTVQEQRPQESAPTLVPNQSKLNNEEANMAKQHVLDIESDTNAKDIDHRRSLDDVECSPPNDAQPSQLVHP